MCYLTHGRCVIPGLHNLLAALGQRLGLVVAHWAVHIRLLLVLLLLMMLLVLLVLLMMLLLMMLVLVLVMMMLVIRADCVHRGLHGHRGGLGLHGSPHRHRRGRDGRRLHAWVRQRRGDHGLRRSSGMHGDRNRGRCALGRL